MNSKTKIQTNKSSKTLANSHGKLKYGDASPKEVTSVQGLGSKSKASKNNKHSQDFLQSSEKLTQPEKDLDTPLSTGVSNNLEDDVKASESNDQEKLNTSEGDEKEECQENGHVENGHIDDVDSSDQLSLTDSYVSDSRALMSDDAQVSNPYDVFSGGQGPAEAEISSRQAKIIREILANFDLEDVMDRYRGQSVMQSLKKNSLLLEAVMGNEKIPYSDRKWHEALRQKVMEDLERQQDERERRLAEAETQRILKLKLQGILRDESNKRGDKHDTLSPADKKFEQRQAQKHESLYKPNDIESQMQILSQSGHGSRSKSSHKENGDPAPVTSNEPTNTSHSNEVSESSSNIPTYKSHLGRMKPDNTTVIHPDLEKLYQEEDLEKLYKEAESLVRVSTVKSTHKKPA
ncbi:uncharacterized protein LOC106074658 [Biomphalaria glabrata]|uniref:Uncharacterized protein LOC106074658 n=2 Tax=Biomphalaria glabrata TaxID=6526 RepID=A0A9W3BEQ9_BIOGL|nr:uncharacterized protein LOC106074658 [Biomphalaria glabrata]